MERLRIGTWNVEYAAGVERNRERLARLVGERADVWVLTETHDKLDLSPSHAPVSTGQRPMQPEGGRWVTIWSRWPTAQRVAVDDPVRTVAAIFEGPGGSMLVYGTVLPWHSDPGPTDVPANAWAEMDRVLPKQLAEWRSLRTRFPGVPLVVAGDFNMNLGGKHYYGTNRCRKALHEGISEIELACATETDRIPEGTLRYPPIDHVLLPVKWIPGSRVVSAWEGTTEHGVRLSDHSGLVVEVEL